MQTCHVYPYEGFNLIIIISYLELIFFCYPSESFRLLLIVASSLAILVPTFEHKLVSCFQQLRQIIDSLIYMTNEWDIDFQYFIIPRPRSE
jgi:hypothetical protein